jgi:N-acetylmuramoyl-L-alanine amidase
MGLRVYVGLAALGGAVVFASFGAIGILPPTPSDLTDADYASFEAPVTAAVKQDGVLPAPAADTNPSSMGSLLSPQPIVLLLDQAMPVMAPGAVQLAGRSDSELTTSVRPAPPAPEPKKALMRLEKNVDVQAEEAARPPASANQSGCNRQAFRVVVDVGHTAEVPGAFSARGVPEYEFNLRLAKEIERGLIEAGFARTVLLVTTGPSRPSLFGRVTRANHPVSCDPPRFSAESV